MGAYNPPQRERLIMNIILNPNKTSTSDHSTLYVLTNGPLVQWEKPCTYNVEYKGLSIHKSIMDVSFSSSSIIN